MKQKPEGRRTKWLEGRGTRDEGRKTLRFFVLRPSSFVLRNLGFSLIEVIISIVILSASFLGIAHVLSNTTTQNIDIDISTTAIMLAREVMDTTKAKSFSSIADVSSTSFGGDFSNYTYTVSVNYVNSGALDTTVAGPTSYKRIAVTVTANGWTGNVALYDLKTDV